jgi:hypothetical protein
MTALAAVTLLSGLLVASNVVLAVNATGAFELDGNATSTTGDAGTGADDWDRVCREVVTSGCSTTATTQTAAPRATAVSWISTAAEPIIFTGGGSKDPLDPQDSWLWKPSDTIPDKDTILHAFAARYSLSPNTSTCPSTDPTCEVIYFGSDRFDNGGDAQLGFWFFKNPITRNDVGATSGSHGFTGHHTNGDLLIISDFSNGGTTSTISAYFWDTSCTKAASGKNLAVPYCGGANLMLQATSDAANCAQSNATAAFCGIVNTADGTTSPWPFLDKNGQTTYRQNEFYEAGVNLSKLGIGGECFSSFEAESRASTSPTATLKALAIGNFGSCTSGLVTEPSAGPGPNGSVSIGTGSVSVTDSATVTINGAQTWSGNLKFFLCGPLPTASTCTTNGTQIGPAAGVTVTSAMQQPFVSDSAAITSAANDTIAAPGHYCWRGVFTHITTGVPDATDSSTGECFKVTPATTTINTSATTSVVVGNSIDDTATLSGTANKPGLPVINPTTPGGAAGGTITFKLYGPSDTAVCTDPASGVPGNLVATRVVNVTGDSGSGTPAAVYKASDGTGSGSLSPSTVGTYHWIATYSGDSPNTLGIAGTCGATGETTTITGSASLSTAQRWLPNDTAHVTSTAGTTLAGSVVFTLYNDGTCGEHAATPGIGTSKYTVTRNVVSDADAAPAPTANSRYVSTTNTDFFVTTANDAVAWSWWVTYTDTNLSNPAGVCEATTPAFTLSD